MSCSKMLGDSTYMVWRKEVPPDNPIDLPVRTIKFGIAGCNAVCDAQVITQEGVGMVMKTNGEHPKSLVATLGDK